jgi:hypothetical protein
MEEESMIKPLNNHLLVEVIDEHSAVHYDKTDEQYQKGRVLGYHFDLNHLTTSTGYTIAGFELLSKEYGELMDKVVYWGQYADSGQVFEQDGKKLALIPFYRLVGYEE